MNVQIRAKEITLTPHLNGHIETAIENFKRYHLDITTILLQHLKPVIFLWVVAGGNHNTSIKIIAS